MSLPRLNFFEKIYYVARPPNTMEEKIFCLSCKSDKVRKLVYGLLDVDNMDMKSFNKKYISAGCEVFDDSPAFHCDACGKDFGNYLESEKK